MVPMDYKIGVFIGKVNEGGLFKIKNFIINGPK